MAVQQPVGQVEAPTEPTEHISFQEFLKAYDGKHAEWLVGKVLVQVSNNWAHQELLGFLIGLFNLYFGFKSPGKVGIAGFPMYVGDDKPACEPDLMIILNEHLERITPTYLNGAADIAIEIVPPESVERDYASKFLEYEAAGVPEYWLFDPERKLSDIYVLQDNQRYTRNPLDAQGRIWSTLLPGFALDPAVLWTGEFPQGLALLKLVSEMTGMEIP